MQNESLLIQASKFASYGSAGTTVISGITLNQWGIIVGIVCWVVSVIANIYFHIRRDKREALEKKMAMRYQRKAFEELGAGKWAVWQQFNDTNKKKQEPEQEAEK